MFLSKHQRRQQPLIKKNPKSRRQQSSPNRLLFLTVVVIVALQQQQQQHALLSLPLFVTASSSPPPPPVQNYKRLPFTLGVRDSIMIGHSFHGNPDFGPAGNMHGATYTCDVEFCCAKLHPRNNWVIDIGKAGDILSDVLSRYDMKNLDEVFPNGEMTTTEFMARAIQRGVAERAKVECGFEGVVRVKLWESHKAWASFEDEV